MDCSSLRSITIPQNVTVIGKSAFNGCTKLNTVKFAGDQLRTIRQSAFADCTSLSKCDLPDSLQEIEHQAFFNCKRLRHLTLPESMKTIGTLAFDRCTGLTVVELNDGLDSIAEDAFDDNSRGLKFIVRKGTYGFDWVTRRNFSITAIE